MCNFNCPSVKQRDITKIATDEAVSGIVTPLLTEGLFEGRCIEKQNMIFLESRNILIISMNIQLKTHKKQLLIVVRISLSLGSW